MAQHITTTAVSPFQTSSSSVPRPQHSMASLNVSSAAAAARLLPSAATNKLSVVSSFSSCNYLRSSPLVSHLFLSQVILCLCNFIYIYILWLILPFLFLPRCRRELGEDHCGVGGQLTALRPRRNASRRTLSS